jgi:hypothetical protein
VDRCALISSKLLAHARHVVDRHDHLELEGLGACGVHDGNLAPRAGSTKEGGDGLERTLRGRQPDALRRRPRQRRQALQADGEVRAALRAGDGVHLVDDDVLDAAQRLPRLARQHQVQALGRGDQDVRRVPRQLPPRIRRGVTRPRADPHLRQGEPRALGGAPDARQRRAQVSLHVVGERLERRDVQDAQPLLPRARFGLAEEPVQCPQERGEGLAAAGRGVQERVRPACDGRPAERLRTGGFGERLREPGARR